MQTVSAAATIFNGHGPAVHVQERRLLYGKNSTDKTSCFSYKKKIWKIKIKKLLKISSGDLLSWTIRRQSLDARKKPELFFVYTVEAEVKKEKQVLKKGKQ